MNVIQRQVQTAINNIQNWSVKHGFTFSTTKKAGVHFCRKRKLHLDPEIQLDGHKIPFVNEIRFLGIVFDKTLTFLPHIKTLRKRCERAFNILRVLSSTSWAVDQPSMMRIYRSSILSKMDYGCMIYGSARKSVLQKLAPQGHIFFRCDGFHDPEVP
ncbi:hypothetical protein AVEN_68055-1 [Araneus ventricosus]|uniref:Reverse transcriptase domain-containing protein n=1 Tax=Araneus ventricosus TaxID=182803 RepID=A0A4Y2M6R6_ARAVE|nr:hypothetical protein AVEN_68055-1 [Araneus ventricosus]